jgi:hypothetical protein
MTNHDFVFMQSVFGEYYFMCEIVFIEISDNTINFTIMCLTSTSKNNMHYVYSNQECNNKSKSTMQT